MLVPVTSHLNYPTAMDGCLGSERETKKGGEKGRWPWKIRAVQFLGCHEHVFSMCFVFLIKSIFYWIFCTKMRKWCGNDTSSPVLFELQNGLNYQLVILVIFYLLFGGPTSPNMSGGPTGPTCRIGSDRTGPSFGKKTSGCEKTLWKVGSLGK